MDLLWGPSTSSGKTTDTVSEKDEIKISKTECKEPEDSVKEAENFKVLGVAEWAVESLKAVKIIKPTPVQVMSIPKILRGDDVCGTACTGSGKTAAYAVPILQKLAVDPYGVFATVITPTREITMQVADQFKAFGASFKVHVLTLVGGVEQTPQQRELGRRPPIVVATPGRLRDTLEVHGIIQSFRKLKFLVLDEADRILDDSFKSTIDDIFRLLSPARYQLLLFSATLSPTSLAEANSLSRIGWDKKAYTTVDVGETEESIYTSAANLQEEYIYVQHEVKLCYLGKIMEGVPEIPWKSCMVFAASCRECEVVRLTLQELGLPVVSLNSLLNQKQRLDSLSMFKLGVAKILVATDVASRGLDIPKVDLVIHYDMPKLSKTYIHRAGRTARAGKSGRCLSMITPHSYSAMKKIETHIGKIIKQVRISDDDAADLLDIVVAARTRAKLSVNQNFGDRLRENEGRKSRDLKLEMQIESATHQKLLQHRKAPPQPSANEKRKKKVVKVVKKKQKIDQ